MPDPRPVDPAARGGRDMPAEAVDPDLSAAVAHSLAQTVEARLRGLRNYSRLLRELSRPS